MFDMYVIFIIISFIYSCVVSYYVIKFGLILIRLEDEIENSLDEIDDSITRFNEILKKPVFFDSLEVRQCVSEIKKTKSMVIKVAQRLTSISSQEFLGEEVDQKSEEENSQSKKKD